MNHQPVILPGILLLALASPAGAQSPLAPTRNQSLGAGAEWAYPVVEGEYLSATPGINGSWRQWLGPHFGIEAEFGWWRKTKSEKYSAPGYHSVQGFVAEPIEASYTARLATYNVGVNVLGRIPIGRAAIVAGGGPGLFAERGSSDSLVNGRRQSWSHTESHFGLQSLAGVEVRVTNRVSAFGGFRIEMRNVRWVDSLVAYPTAGVRVGF